MQPNLTPANKRTLRRRLRRQKVAEWKNDLRAIHRSFAKEAAHGGSYASLARDLHKKEDR